MRIAAGNAQACAAAADRTGEKTAVLVDAARFYLQQMLFRSDADSYRVLGLDPAAPRDVARDHMRWLMQWLHPDRNSSMEAVYAERVVKAWRDVSASNSVIAGARSATARRVSPGRGGRDSGFRIPLIARSTRRRPAPPLPRSTRIFVVWAVPAGLAIVFLALWSLLYFVGPEQIAALTSLR
jgi:hypothetical protein